MNDRLPVYEISASAGVNGRRPIKAILHEIHSDESQFQHNGISWSEEYTKANMASVVGMSIVAEFLSDDRDTPYGHGMTDIRDNLPLFEDATMVGHFHKAYIDDVEVCGQTKRALVAEGTLDEMRYPKFVGWLRGQLESSSAEGSVEIVGKPEHGGRIIYSGGWKEEGRIPQIYDYSGYAILSIKPADDTAVVLELNNKTDLSHEGEEQMDEKMLADIKSALVQAVTETNTKNEEYETQITELNNTIAQLRADIEAKDAELSAKNDEVVSLNSQIEQYKTDIEAKDAQIAEANAETEKVKNDNAKAELNALLSSYSEEQKAVAQEEIDAFMEKPGSVEINSIIGKICTDIVRKSREAQEEPELDIFGGVDDGDASGNDDDVNVF